MQRTRGLVTVHLMGNTPMQCACSAYIALPLDANLLLWLKIKSPNGILAWNPKIDAEMDTFNRTEDRADKQKTGQTPCLSM